MNAMPDAKFVIENNTVYGTNKDYHFAAFDLYQNCSRDNAYTVVSKDNDIIVDLANDSNEACAFCLEGNGGTNVVVLENGSTLNDKKVGFEDFETSSLPSNYNKFYGIDVELDENGKKLGPSKYTVNLINDKLIPINYPDQDPALIHYNDREKDKLYIFGRYRREDGMNAVKYSMFGCDFYWHKNPLAFGDTIEFCIAEIMDSGTIPFLDYSTGVNCKCHKNGYRTDDSLLSKNAGVYLKYDCSNIDEVVEQLNYLSSNKAAYDDYRMNCFNIFKEHYNPIAIANRLVKDLTTEDNYDGLAEFGIKKLF
jgi:hypothetical protein